MMLQRKFTSKYYKTLNRKTVYIIFLIAHPVSDKISGSMYKKTLYDT